MSVDRTDAHWTHDRTRDRAKQLKLFLKRQLAVDHSPVAHRSGIPPVKIRKIGSAALIDSQTLTFFYWFSEKSHVPGLSQCEWNSFHCELCWRSIPSLHVYDRLYNVMHARSLYISTMCSFLTLLLLWEMFLAWQYYG